MTQDPAGHRRRAGFAGEREDGEMQSGCLFPGNPVENSLFCLFCFYVVDARITSKSFSQ